jgi:hypothetical protein
VGVVARAAEPVAGEYIVMLRDGKARADIDARAVAGRCGGTVLDTWTSALNGFAVRLDATASTVHAYIRDTGIRTTHNDFGGQASVGYDAIGDG